MAGGGEVSEGCSGGEQENVMAEASQEGASFRSGNGGVTFASEGRNFRGIIGSVLSCNRQFGGASAAILSIVEQGF